MIHHQCRPVRRKHNGAVVCRAQSCRRTVVIVVIYCPPRGRIVSGVWVSASFQIIPRLVGWLKSYGYPKMAPLYTVACFLRTREGKGTEECNETILAVNQCSQVCDIIYKHTIHLRHVQQCICDEQSDVSVNNFY